MFEDVHVPKESKQKYMHSTSAVLTGRLMSIVYDEQQILASRTIDTDLEQLIAAVPLHIDPFPQAAFLVAQQQTSTVPGTWSAGSAKRQSL